MPVLIGSFEDIVVLKSLKKEGEKMESKKAQDVKFSTTALLQQQHELAERNSNNSSRSAAASMYMSQDCVVWNEQHNEHTLDDDSGEEISNFLLPIDENEELPSPFPMTKTKTATRTMTNEQVPLRESHRQAQKAPAIPSLALHNGHRLSSPPIVTDSTTNNGSHSAATSTDHSNSKKHQQNPYQHNKKRPYSDPNTNNKSSTTGRNDNEIESIFCHLDHEKDNPIQNNHCAAIQGQQEDPPTPLHKNNNRQSFPPGGWVRNQGVHGQQQQQQASQMAHLLSNNNKRSKKALQVPQGNQQQQLASMAGVRNISPLPEQVIGRRNSTAVPGTSNSEGFEDLLNQVETPRGNHRHPQNQQQHPQQNWSSKSGTSGSSSRAAPTSQASSMASKIKPTALNANAFNQTELPHTKSKIPLDKENVGANAARPTNAGYKTIKTWQPVNGSKTVQQQVVKPLANHTTTSTGTTRNGPFSANPKQPLHGSIQQARQSNLDRAMMPTAERRPIDAPQTRNPIQKVDESQAKPSILDDDEFGDFDFSEADLAHVDSLVAATQAQTFSQEPSQVQSAMNTSVLASNATAPRNESVPTCHAPTLSPETAALAADASFWNDSDPIDGTNPPNSFANEAQISSNGGHCKDSHDEDDDDQFGDFPDIDFDALDAAVAMQTQQPHGTRDQAVPSVQVSNGAATATEIHTNYVVQNPRSESTNDITSYMNFTRYVVRRVETCTTTFTKELRVQLWDLSMEIEGDNERQALHRTSDMKRKRPTKEQQAQPHENDEENFGLLTLRGAWFYLNVEVDDVLHICSLTGRFRTDPSALPLTLDTDPPPGSEYDDLVPILHPEMLAIPTTITETLDCERRAVLKTRLGSKLSTSKALLLGTMRHSLFEFALKAHNTSQDAVRCEINKIVRMEAEKLVGCRMPSKEAERELWRFWPQVARFKREYFNETPQHDGDFVLLDSPAAPRSTRFSATAVKGVEEEVSSPELGLKGNLDVLVEAMAVPDADFPHWLQTNGQNAGNAKSLMSIELKTHHNSKPQSKHFAQLTFYTVMLLARYGHTASPGFKMNPQLFDAIAGSMLLYVNPESLTALHVAPQLGEIKSLIEQRNIVCAASKLASKPRGVTLTYETDDGTPEYVQPPGDKSFRTILVY